LVVGVAKRRETSEPETTRQRVSGRRSLLEHILSHNDEQLKTVVEMGQELDRLILAKAMEWARRAYRVVAEALDEQLFKAKGDGLVSEGKRRSGTTHVWGK